MSTTDNAGSDDDDVDRRAAELARRVLSTPKTKSTERRESDKADSRPRSKEKPNDDRGSVKRRGNV
jgi:hypothetical protein